MEAASIVAESLLVQFDYPRENASPGLESARALLDSLLRVADLEPQALHFSCSPYRAEVAALFLALAAALSIAAAWTARRRLWGGFVIAMLAAAAAGGGVLDVLLPPVPQASLQVVVEPLRPAVREVLVSAHYDTKTEPLDHFERSLLFAFAAVSVLVAAIASLLRLRRARAAALVAALSLAASCVQLFGGRFITDKSTGAVDDAAACALLAEFASRAQQRPLLSTRLRFVWFSGEEVGAQGSSAFAATQHATLPRAMVNLEAIGAGPACAFAPHEWTSRGLRKTHARLIEALQLASDGTAQRLPYPIFTDAGPFLRRGVPALTLLNVPENSRVIRELHSAHDDLSRVDRRGLQESGRVLRMLLLALDGGALDVSATRRAPAGSPAAVAQTDVVEPVLQ